MSNDDKLFELMSKMYSEMTLGFKNVDARLNKVDQRFDKVDARLDKLELLQESTNKNLETIAEVQQNFQEQIGRDKTENAVTLREQLDLIELAVTNNSKSVSKTLDTIDEKIDILQVDVNHLASKTAQSDNKIIELSRNVSKFKY
jgi:tetrahydromethanopterin S-methyltransferase subunit G